MARGRENIGALERLVEEKPEDVVDQEDAGFGALGAGDICDGLGAGRGQEVGSWHTGLEVAAGGEGAFPFVGVGVGDDGGDGAAGGRHCDDGLIGSMFLIRFVGGLEMFRADEVGSGGARS